MGSKNIEILDGKHRAYGETVMRWAGDPSSRPVLVRPVDENGTPAALPEVPVPDSPYLAEQLAGIATISDEVEHVAFLDTPIGTVVFRLPAIAMLTAGLAEARGMDIGTYLASYPFPQAYRDIVDGVALEPDELFFTRLADYNTGQCQ